jgi:D-3-phosphoglycerate dehydrogenase
VVLVTSRSFSSGDLDLAEELVAAGCEVLTGSSDHDLDVLRPLLTSITAWVAGAAPVTADHLDAAPKLRILARYGVGVRGTSPPPQRAASGSRTPPAPTRAPWPTTPSR